jgi:predicted RNase H-like HicB family nuclease
MRKFKAYIEFDPETKLYVGIIPSVQGAYTTGETLEELRHNLLEVLTLCLEELGDEIGEFPEFIGLETIEATV